MFELTKHQSDVNLADWGIDGEVIEHLRHLYELQRAHDGLQHEEHPQGGGGRAEKGEGSRSPLQLGELVLIFVPAIVVIIVALT